jgi:DNA-directed RNA polymerase specialized sigma24 family protein
MSACLTRERPVLSMADVWTLLCAGCNAREIAAYAGVSLSTAWALIARATRCYAKAAA